MTTEYLTFHAVASYSKQHKNYLGSIIYFKSKNRFRKEILFVALYNFLKIISTHYKITLKHLL